jgi:hypothetical protein
MANKDKKDKKAKSESKEVAPVFGGNVAMTGSAALAAAIKESSDKDPRGSMGDSDYLNFSGKSGRITIGADKRLIQNDELWVANISSFEDGWICWKGGKPVATRMSNIMDGSVAAPDMSEFGPFDGDGEGWYQAKAVTLKSLDNDQQGYFKINSVSGVSALADLQKLIFERIENGQSAWPVMAMDAEEFTAGGYKNFKPKFDVEGWLNDEQIASALNDPESDIEELMNSSDKKPKKTKAKAKVEEPEEDEDDDEDEDEDDMPKPRRRSGL